MWVLSKELKNMITHILGVADASIELFWEWSENMEKERVFWTTVEVEVGKTIKRITYLRNEKFPEQKFSSLNIDWG